MALTDPPDEKWPKQCAADNFQIHQRRPELQIIKIISNTGNFLLNFGPQIIRSRVGSRSIFFGVSLRPSDDSRLYREPAPKDRNSLQPIREHFPNRLRPEKGHLTAHKVDKLRK